jgi:uncharacterized protein YndB with AHSA1/START domain
MKVQAHVADRVMKPTGEVFDAIVNPAKITKFFASNASGPFRTGETVTWTFADVGRSISPKVLAVEPETHIAFEWDASGDSARVDITLTPYEGDTTRVVIVEDGWPMDAKGIKRALQQTQGWTDFICCMKAYLQFGVNLRAGRTRGTH